MMIIRHIFVSVSIHTELLFEKYLQYYVYDFESVVKIFPFLLSALKQDLIEFTEILLKCLTLYVFSTLSLFLRQLHKKKRFQKEFHAEQDLTMF